MTDLVERLRADAATWHANCHPADLQREAANEIDRLRERVAELQARCGYLESLDAFKGLPKTDYTR